MSLTDKIASERRARLAAERMLELKSKELFEANRKLSYHARALSDQVVEQRRDIDTIRTEAAALKTQNTETKAHLAQATQEVTITNKRLLHSMEAITDGIAIFDAQDCLISANSAWFALFDGLKDIAPGISYTEVLKLGVEEGVIDHAGLSRTEWIDQMLSRWDREEIEDMTLRLWDGRYITVHDRRAETRDTVTLAIDVTEQMERERELEEARQKAETATRAKSAFLANMSHELRTPMNGVVGMADLLAEGELDDEERLYVDTIRNSGEALLGIINDVLDFSKLEAEKMELRTEFFDLEHLIHQVALLLDPTVQDKGLELVVDYDIFLPSRVEGDPGRLRQVLTNLVGNAVKFTQTGHVIIRVVGATDDATGQADIRIVVEDTGIGIPADKLDHVFEQFNQVENERNRKFDGTGLGLAISKQLITLMEGEIWVNSVLHEGSSFGFRLNLNIDGTEPQLDRSLPGGMDRVLVVDHRELEASILCRRFDQLGATATLCTEGAAAQSLLAGDTAFDLCIVAHKLPDCDGSVVAQSLRDFGVTSPIFLVTESSATVDQAAADALDLQVRRRPFRLANLLETLPQEVIEAVADDAAPDLTQVWDADLEQEQGSNVDPTDPVDDQTSSVAHDLSDTDNSATSLVSPAEAEDSTPMPVSFSSRRAAPNPPEPPEETTAEAALPVFQAIRRAPPGDEATSDKQADPAIELPNVSDLAEPVPEQRQSERASVPDDRPDGDVEPQPVEVPQLDEPAAEESVPTLDRSEEMPVSSPEPEPAQVITAAEASVAAAAAPMRVLAAEDNRTNQLVFRKMIKALNIDLMMVENGRLAVEAFQTFRPHLIFMDISMPEMDGKQATGAIRQLEAEGMAPADMVPARVPIVALTAHAMAGDADDILEAGLDHYLTKPLKKSAITGHIHDHHPRGFAPLQDAKQTTAA
ncbi:ATP-binding protein [Actibacterium sp. 188UL27-1]|uniref:ATP-binding protein n=1 Tax=Actibacterium sp. 188UL27-1 TaxID=2786961 RepID=UPI0019595DFB|nr:ATP-binding protein [Actibacterium sp. 188UL27-1]MBM7067107.1 response regulator [Actibacterium sp. 188UL27-1]